jgi:hypothetical protein
MKASCLFGVFLLLLTATPGCHKASRTASDSAPNPAQNQAPLTPQETLAKQAVDLLNQASELLGSIHDRASAAAAAPKLKAIAAQLQDLNRRGVPLGSQIRESPQAVGRFMGDLEKGTQRYADLAVKMLAQENLLGPEFQEALRELGKLPQ